jgi:hypothetical protein
MLLYNNVAELRQYRGTILLSGEKASLSAGDSGLDVGFKLTAVCVVDGLAEPFGEELWTPIRRRSRQH